MKGKGAKKPDQPAGLSRLKVQASQRLIQVNVWAVDAPVTFTKYVPAVRSAGRITWPWTLFKVPATAPVRVTMRTLKVCVVGRAKVAWLSEGLGKRLAAKSTAGALSTEATVANMPRWSQKLHP